jgi:cytoskeletal protein CcmA (bactofilin family)
MSSQDSEFPEPQEIPLWLSDAKRNSSNGDSSPSVVLGGAMPPMRDIPVLTEVVVDSTDPVRGLSDSRPSGLGTAGDQLSMTTLENGWHFKGKAFLNGTCTVAGIYEGDIVELDGGEVTVVVTETGQLTGDVRAASVSVMGQYSGLMDASGGKVELHASAVISGHVKYGKLQVNGADLNATLERVPNRVR